jgi:hypothetical protein
LSLTVATALSGCLVDKKKPSQVTKISRTTDNLHIYKDGESIDYNVRAVNTGDGSVSYGQLHIQWASHANLIDPIDGVTPYPVLEETTTLDFDDASSEPDSSVIRYISQDSAGNITLHAISDGSGTPSDPTLFWPSLSGNIPTSPVATPIIFGSPLTVGNDPLSTFVSPVEFDVMEGCGSGTCPTQLYHFNDSFMVVSDSDEISTNLGTFTNPFRLSFNGGTSTRNSGLALSLLGDIRDACGDINESVTHGTDAGGGQLFVMPEIGVIYADYWCHVIVGSGKTVHYTMTLNNTSISTPW